VIRCRSWRPVADSPHPSGHLPGHCRRCWGICLHPVAPGMPRCTECEVALASHLDAAVRSALAEEPSVSMETLTLLVTDMDAVVATAARWNLDHRLPPAHSEDTETHSELASSTAVDSSPWAGRGNR